MDALLPESLEAKLQPSSMKKLTSLQDVNLSFRSGVSGGPLPTKLSLSGQSDALLEVPLLAGQDQDHSSSGPSSRSSTPSVVLEDTNSSPRSQLSAFARGAMSFSTKGPKGVSFRVPFTRTESFGDLMSDDDDESPAFSNRVWRLSTSARAQFAESSGSLSTSLTASNFSPNQTSVDRDETINYNDVVQYPAPLEVCGTSSAMPHRHYGFSTPGRLRSVDSTLDGSTTFDSTTVEVLFSPSLSLSPTHDFTIGTPDAKLVGKMWGEYISAVGGAQEAGNGPAQVRTAMAPLILIIRPEWVTARRYWSRP